MHPAVTRQSRSRGRRLAQSVADLLVGLMPLGALLIGYFVAYLVNLPLSRDPTAGTTNAWGFALHATEPAAVDRAVFGTLPTAWLQARWVRLPDGAWWDAPVAVVYGSHFVVIPVVTAALWFAARHRFAQWIWSVLGLAAAGLVLYIVYPMTPPWLAAEQGLIEPVQRWSGTGWNVLGLQAVGFLQDSGQAGSNPVAAMPSLHAGAATLVAAFFFAGARWWGRILLVAYATAMSLVLVYTAEHYVLDVVVGDVLAVLAAASVGVIFRWRAGVDRAALAPAPPPTSGRPDPSSTHGDAT